MSVQVLFSLGYRSIQTPEQLRPPNSDLLNSDPPKTDPSRFRPLPPNSDPLNSDHPNSDPSQLRHTPPTQTH